MIFAAVTIGTDGAFVATKGQILGLYVGLTVAIGVLNSIPTKYLHRITSTYGKFVHIGRRSARLLRIFLFSLV